MTEVLNTGANTPETTPAPAGHDEKMIARFEASQSNPPVPTEGASDRPVGLPEKFNSIEDMAKAYSELEKKLGAPKEAPAADPKPAALNIEQAAAGTAEEAAAALEGANLDYNSFAQEFATNGELSPESYEKLAKAGIPKEMVDAYVEGQAAKGEQVRTQVLTEVGVEDFAAMSTWAGKSLTPGQLNAYNAAIDSGNVDQMKLAVAGVKARFEAANGVEPSLLGGAGGGSSGDAYRSTEEMKADMRDPRYAKDPAFRADVAAKLSRSSIM